MHGRTLDYAPPVRLAARRIRTVAWTLAMLAFGAPHGTAIAQPLGADLGGLLAAARAANPDLRAAALDTETALARSRGAGLLPDPSFRLTLDEADRERGPRRARNTAFVEQEFPLWGKRDLQRGVARAETERAQHQQAAMVLEVEARLKLAFAEYYAAHELGRQTARQRGSLRGIRGAAEARLAAGSTGPEDALQAGVDEARLEQDLIELDRQKRAAQARINALLVRPTGAPLVDPRAPRPVPPAASLPLPKLAEQLRNRHPSVLAERAEAAAAAASRQLAERGRYPDPVVGVGVIQREIGPTGLMATLGVRIPLQGGIRESQASEATARGAAASARAEAAVARLQGELEQAYWALSAAQRMLRLHHDVVVPRASAARRSALSAYEQGTGEIAALLLAQRSLQQALVEERREEVRQQALLAEIERLTGGPP